MGVTARRGRKNDRKRRGGNLSTGSINPCADTVQAAFFMQSWQNKGLYPNSVDLQKGNCIPVSRAGPSISRQEGNSDIWALATFAGWCWF